jgi:N utilization substance protein B
MGRRQARESAMQVLFQVDVGKVEVETAFKYLQENFVLADRDMEFARYLVEGVTSKLPELDEVIAGFSRDWQLERLAAVDRNILRLALFEILFDEQIPYSVSINEAVELAKIYGGEKSSKFVNGILSSVVHKEKQHVKD